MADDAMLKLAEALGEVLARPAAQTPAAAPADPAAPAPAPTPQIPAAPATALPPAVAAAAEQAAEAGIRPGGAMVTREQLRGMSAKQISELPQSAVNAALAEPGA